MEKQFPRWKKEGTGYEIIYHLYDGSGNVLADIFKGGKKWYPWSWYLKGIKMHGDSETLRAAKEAVAMNLR